MDDNDFDLTHSNGIHIPYLSASTINSFIERRPQFYGSKVKRKPFCPNPNMARGTAIEHGINMWLQGAEPSELLDHALEKYKEEIHQWCAQGNTPDPEIEASLPGLMECAYKHFDGIFDLNFSPPTSQERIEIEIPGVSRTIIGFLDYFDGIIHDCKVTKRAPSKLSQGYILQATVYRIAKETEAWFEFIVANKTPKSVRIKLTDEEFVFGKSYLTKAAQVLEEVETCEDPRRMLELTSFPNLDSFWDIGEKKEAAAEWGIVIPDGLFDK